jgi:regulator of sigma E protease
MLEFITTYGLSALVFLLIFAVIILVHEAGHFWAARISGIGVKEFGFGLPPRAWGYVSKKSKVLYSINWLPIGGFVRMVGEDSANKAENRRKNAFGNRPLWGRIFTVCAGVLMNFLLAFIILWIGFMVGMKPMSVMIDKTHFEQGMQKGFVEVNETGVLITQVEANSPAAKMNLQVGDFITHLDVTKVKTPQEFIDVKEKGLRGRGWHLSLVRTNEEGKIIKSFAKQIIPDEKGNIGIGLGQDYIFPPQHLSITAAATLAGSEMWQITVATINKLGELLSDAVTKQSAPEGVGGPVAIANLTHHVVQDGKSILLVFQFMAILSLSLGVINILPVPALDGGRLVFLLWELVTRRKPNQSVERIIHLTGFAFVLVLLLFLTINDISRIFG